ncbi:MAG TPA: nitrilase-related carbon-nitrogen hydrolase, partial [Candidatus Krumholzibacterium sp.]|nr:nitrilase-related carbon-nitrogen hydrolase [Candidatus Krumholzibacterium sp.]
MAGTRGKIRIGLAQVNPVVGDLEGNAALVRRKIAEAKKLGVQVLAFPELVLCGYPTEDLLLKPSFLGDCERTLRKTAASARGIAVIVGSPESVPAGGRGELYNTASVLYRGKVAARYRKLNLPNYGVFDEKRYFTAGKHPLVVEFGDVPIGISVCEDIWIEDGPASIESSCGGAGILINISASPYHMLKGREREQLMQKRARQYGAYLCYVNLLGGQDELVFDGSSVICSPDGKTLARARSFREEMIVADIPVPERKSPCGHSEEAHSIGDRVETVSLPALPSRSGIRLRTIKVPRHPGPVEEVYEALVTGTRDYVEKNGFRGVVLGLSGGIDSALTAAIAVDALGPLKVNGITMP